MKKIILIFLIFFSYLNASECTCPTGYTWEIDTRY